MVLTRFTSFFVSASLWIFNDLGALRSLLSPGSRLCSPVACTNCRFWQAVSLTSGDKVLVVSEGAKITSRAWWISTSAETRSLENWNKTTSTFVSLLKIRVSISIIIWRKDIYWTFPSCPKLFLSSLRGRQTLSRRTSERSPWFELATK